MDGKIYMRSQCSRGKKSSRLSETTGEEVAVNSASPQGGSVVLGWSEGAVPWATARSLGRVAVWCPGAGA